MENMVKLRSLRQLQLVRSQTNSPIIGKAQDKGAGRHLITWMCDPVLIVNLLPTNEPLTIGGIPI